MGTLRIRRVLRPDLDMVYEIEKQSFTDYYPRTFLSYLYDVHRSTFLVAEKEKAVVGYVIAAATRDLGRIISIAVHPCERKKAVGSAIMREVLKILQGKDVTTVRLEVRHSNVEAQMFYEFLGFTRSHTIAAYYGDEDAIIYTLQL